MVVHISKTEIVEALDRAKMNKSPGVDNVLNEYFCKFKDVFVPMLYTLFNLILDRGCFPKS